MLVTQWLLHCALAFALPTFSQHFQHQSSLESEQPVGLDEPELSKNPLFSLHKNLVNIESISGHEQAVAEFLEAFLISHNYTVERQYLDPRPHSIQISQAEELRHHRQRFNLLAYPGEHRQTPVLLSSVSTLSEPYHPFSYRLLSLLICWESKRLSVPVENFCNMHVLRTSSRSSSTDSEMVTEAHRHGSSILWLCNP